MANKTYGRKNNLQATQKYTPGIVGKMAVGITAPSAIIAFVTTLIAFSKPDPFLLVALITYAIAFVGGIIMFIDIIVFNRRQAKRTQKSKEPKELDIVRIVHMLIGIAVGIAIGYLIWGIKR